MTRLRSIMARRPVSVCHDCSAGVEGNPASCPLCGACLDCGRKRATGPMVAAMIMKQVNEPVQVRASYKGVALTVEAMCFGLCQS